MRAILCFIRDRVTYEFHHLGIPANEVRPGERYSARFCMYTSDSDCQLVHVQWHRYTADSCLDPLVRSLPHAAFKVDNLGRAVVDRKVLLGPYEPISGYRVVIIDDGGMPVELIETELTDQEIWGRATSGKDAFIYRDVVPEGSATEGADREARATPLRVFRGHLLALPQHRIGR
jgi:hypothetical protein